MNYRHGFHAGNFADVVKHAVFARIVAHLREKPAAFRIIDTHAGPGLTQLTGAQAQRTGEWREGIARLRAEALTGPVQRLLAPYLDVVAAFNPPDRLCAYPGSALLARAWLRPQDRLIACELEPGAAASLKSSLRGDRRAKAILIDGWTALSAFIPPKERRGVVLLDPPFERSDEFDHLRSSLKTAYRKWATGTFLVWYPIKERRLSTAFVQDVARIAIGKILRAELVVMPTADGKRLSGCGVLVINPPFVLERELALLLPALSGVFGRDGAGRASLDWPADEK